VVIVDLLMASKKRGSDVGLHRLKSGSFLWVPAKNGDYELAQVTRRTSSMLQLETQETGKMFSLDLEDPDVAVLKANRNIVDDMTSLEHLHVPAILFNLRERSLENKPYTFLGNSVLVTVNPLRHLDIGDNALGLKEAALIAHPYAIAELAYEQLRFAMSRKREDAQVDQSILVSGESGAGKTESSKMVLKHLVHRCLRGNDAQTGSDLDRRLLDSNPILEAFGNAATNRNYNSSRFGKFLKLHFNKRKGSGELEICGASVETYLLERSRVTTHGEGERGFHIFYLLLSGASKAMRKELDLDQSFEYTRPSKSNRSEKPKKATTRRSKSLKINLDKLGGEDKKKFKELSTALETIGIPEDGKSVSQRDIFAALAAMLHLGNVGFVDDESSTEGAIATVVDAAPLEKAAALLGVKTKKLKTLFIERVVKTVGEEIVTRRDAQGAKDAVDGVVKRLYVCLFDWLVERITVSLSEDLSSSNLSKSNFIGVLDIFGFESFAVNDFEQLLINYTNEALQKSFNMQIFDSEAALYEHEGLLVASEERIPPQDNHAAVELLSGEGKKPGILGLIDAEGRSPQPLDEKLNSAIHKMYKGHPNFPEVHARDRRTTFRVRHFAGDVMYTVGSFLEKNADKVPKEVDELFMESSEELIGLMIQGKQTSGDPSLEKHKRVVRGITDTIISGFQRQMDDLVETLHGTRCSFIRCVKPNPHMVREKDDRFGMWFDNSYVVNQLENLSIPQTTQVLQGGFPTRIPYDTFLELYTVVLPLTVLNVWQTLGQGDDRAFVKALFYAFEIPPSSFKLGMSKVFFKSGMLTRLTEILNQTQDGDVDETVVRRFRSSFARQLWRKLYAIVRAETMFLRLLEFSRERNGAATILQRLARNKLAEFEAKAKLARLRETKRKEEEVEAKRRAKAARKAQKELEREAQEAADKKRREAEVLQEQERIQAEIAEREEEEARRAAEEKLRVQHYREQAEREERDARVLERQETQRTINSLGGEEAYFAQKELERSIKFDNMVRVREFKKYITDEHKQSIDTASYYSSGASDFSGDREDLEDLARRLSVVSQNDQRALSNRVENKRETRRAQKSKSSSRKSSKSSKLVDARNEKRRSYAPSPSTAKTAKEAALRGVRKLKQERLSLGILEKEGVKFAIEIGNMRRSKIRKAGCFLGMLAGKKTHAIGSAAMYSWQTCFLVLQGFQLIYFEDAEDDDELNRLKGMNELGRVEMGDIASFDRYQKTSENFKIGTEIDPQSVLRLQVRGQPGFHFLLAFNNRAECNMWTSKLEKVKQVWQAEADAVKKMRSGNLAKETLMEEYKMLLNAGVITKKQYKQALLQQASNEVDYVEQEIAMFGEESYDQRVVCDECRSVNFLVEKDPDGGYWCHGCGTELYPPGQERHVQAWSGLTSLLEPAETEERSSAFHSFPKSVELADGSTLTIFECELLRKPRYDIKTQERKYYFSFRCQFDENRDGTTPQYWFIDKPFDAFKNLEKSIQEYSQEWQHEFRGMPKLEESVLKDPYKKATERLHCLNEFIEKFVEMGKRDQMLFAIAPVRIFFNLQQIQVAPLTLQELRELKPTFDTLNGYLNSKKRPTQELLALYDKIMMLIGRLEASADEENVFNSTEHTIAVLTFSEKGEIFRTANDYLHILEAFNEKIDEQFRQMNAFG